MQHYICKLSVECACRRCGDLVILSKVVSELVCEKKLPGSVEAVVCRQKEIVMLLLNVRHTVLDL